MLNNFRQLFPRTISPMTAMLSSVRSTGSQAGKPPVSANIPSGVWKLGRLNHLAVAVPNLEESTRFFKNVLQAQSVSAPVAQKDHGVYTVFVEFGNTKIELLHPLGEKSPIANFLQKNKKGGIHHVCLEVDNLDAAIKDIRKQRIRTLSENTQIGAHGKPVIFLHPKDCGGVLIELEQA